MSTKLKMKVVVNKSKSKVLFAEANNHVVDILLRFLTLPLGKIVRILDHHYGNEAPVLGSITNLYKDLFNRANFSAGDSNRLLFMGSVPLETECRKIIRDITSSDDYSTQYLCRSSNCPFFGIQNANIYSELSICVCCEEPLLDANGENYTVVSTMSFIICDNLRVFLNDIGLTQTLNKPGSKDTEGAEIMSFKFGVDDVMDLLKFSLISSTPLTDLVFKNSETTSSIAVEHESVIWFDRDNKRDEWPDIEKMIFKVCLQKSSNKFLFVVAFDQFVEFVFSLLNFTLEKCQYYSGGNGNIGFLYNSFEGFSNTFFRNRGITDWLEEPDIGRGYISNYEDKVECKYDAEERNLFIVSNDLRVTPFSLDYIITTLNGQGIPLSDVIEKEVLFGRDEAMILADASFRSEMA